MTDSTKSNPPCNHTCDCTDCLWRCPNYRKHIGKEPW